MQKSLKSTSTSCEDILDDTQPEPIPTTTTYKEIFDDNMTTQPEPNCCDKGTQVDLAYDDGFNIFICNRFEKGEISVTETQACFSKSVRIKSVKENLKKVVNKGCGNHR